MIMTSPEIIIPHIYAMICWNCEHFILDAKVFYGKFYNLDIIKKLLKGYYGKNKIWSYHDMCLML